MVVLDPAEKLKQHYLTSTMTSSSSSTSPYVQPLPMEEFDSKTSPLTLLTKTCERISQGLQKGSGNGGGGGSTKLQSRPAIASSVSPSSVASSSPKSLTPPSPKSAKSPSSRATTTTATAAATSTAVSAATASSPTLPPSLPNHLMAAAAASALPYPSPLGVLPPPHHPLLPAAGYPFPHPALLPPPPPSDLTSRLHLQAMQDYAARSSYAAACAAAAAAASAATTPTTPSYLFPGLASPSPLHPATSSTPFTCNWVDAGSKFCGRAFPTTEALMQHLKSHTEPSSSPPTSTSTSDALSSLQSAQARAAAAAIAAPGDSLAALRVRAAALGGVGAGAHRFNPYARPPTSSSLPATSIAKPPALTFPF